MKRENSCENLVILEFQRNILGGMISAEELRKKVSLSGFALNTIKSTLSRLKKKKLLQIAFRTRGKQTEEINITGEKYFKPGRCYYVGVGKNDT